MCSAPESNELWFERLLVRIEEGLAVPFLGAGISVSAKPSRSVAVPAGFRPRVKWLNTQLVAMLLPVLATHGGRARLESTVFPDAWLHGREVRHPAPNGTVEKPDRRIAERWLRGPKANARALRVLAWCARGTGPLRSEALEALVRAARNRLDQLAEAAIWEFDERKVCEKLRIELFAALEPTPAHVYLAYLAREGLVSEIFTTNYDTCVEKAFERTFHPDERMAAQRQHYSVDPPPDVESDAEELQVIRSLDEYRRRGGLRRVRSDHLQARPSLRLFKLNGCALDYRQVGRSADDLEQRCPAEWADAERIRRRAAARIILTERQLQSFRRESWARDLFQDRARCQAFVFSGFGSEEPQIRHTALAVMNEWGNNGSKPCWKLSNAPFMAAFGAELSFTQYQVMRGYRDAHECSHCDGRGSPSCEAKQPQNSFTGRDFNWFSGKLPGDGKVAQQQQQQQQQQQLPADLFWQRVFQASFLRQVKQLCQERGPFTSWVGDHVCEPGRALQGFVEWLHLYAPHDRKGRGSTKGEALRDGIAAPFPWTTPFRLLDHDALGELGAGDTVAPLVVSRWLMAIRGNEKRWRKASLPSHPYFPLREEPLLVVGSLFLTYWITKVDTGRGASLHAGAKKNGERDAARERRAEASADRFPPKPGPLGLQIAFPGSQWHEQGGKSQAHETSLVVHLISEEWPESGELPEQGWLVRQVVVPSLARLPQQSRMMWDGEQGIRMGRCVRISAEHLLKVERGNRGALLRAFAEASVWPRRARLTRLPEPPHDCPEERTA